MSNPVRFVAAQERGSFLYDMNQVPYITGCKLPPISRNSLTETQFELTGELVRLQNRLGVQLHFFIQNTAILSSFTMFLSVEEHQEFLMELSDASAIYLLEGDSAEYSFRNRNEFFHRLSECGHGFAISVQVRELLKSLKTSQSNSGSTACGNVYRFAI